MSKDPVKFTNKNERRDPTCAIKANQSNLMTHSTQKMDKVQTMKNTVLKSACFTA